VEILAIGDWTTEVEFAEARRHSHTPVSPQKMFKTESSNTMYFSVTVLWAYPVEESPKSYWQSLN